MTRKAINDGGSAFPMPASEDHLRGGVCAEYGMTLRDWFAGQALEALANNSAIQDSYINPDHPDAHDEVGAELFAKAAYQIADAMLKARG